MATISSTITGRWANGSVIPAPPSRARGSSRLLPGSWWGAVGRGRGSFAASGDLAAAGGRDLLVELARPHLGAVEVPGDDHRRARAEVGVLAEALVDRHAALLVERDERG